MIPDLEIVCHIWQYHRLACLQLSSLVSYPPRCQVLYRPCITLEDEQTVKTIEWFMPRMPATVAIAPHVMERRRLMRRAIGRNECALTSLAPLVWFADCDYGAPAVDIEAIINAWPKGCKLAHPGHVHASVPEHGMELIESVREPTIAAMTLVDFPLAQKHRVAIGGLQFFDGDHCRKTGYCGPVGRGRLFRQAERWQPTKCDRWARAAAGEDVTLPITALWRVRHSTRSEGHPEDARL